MRWWRRSPQYAVPAAPTSRTMITTSQRCEWTAAQNGDRAGRRGARTGGADTTSGSTPVLA